MKYLTIILVTTFLGSSVGEMKKSNAKSIQLSEINTIDYEYLYQTWYVKQILVNGKEDKKNYPPNNAELTFNRDMTVTSIDRVIDLVDKGTWEIKKPDMFTINTEEGPVTFRILKLTKSELETKMVTDEIDMVIKYKNIK